MELRVGLLVGRRATSAALREILFAVGDVSVVWLAGTVESGLDLAAADAPDVVLVDLESVERASRPATTFEGPLIALSRAGGAVPPGLIDCTALVLPAAATAESLAAALDLIRTHGVRRPNRDRTPMPAVRQDQSRREPIEWLIAEQSGGRIRQIPVGEALWFEAIHNAVRVHTREGALDLPIGISVLAERLPPAGFVRIHRSSIVNLDAVRDLSITIRGQARVTLVNGPTLIATSAGRAQLLEKLRERGLGRADTARSTAAPSVSRESTPAPGRAS